MHVANVYHCLAVVCLYTVFARENLNIMSESIMIITCVLMAMQWKGAEEWRCDVTL